MSRYINCETSNPKTEVAPCNDSLFLTHVSIHCELGEGRSVGGVSASYNQSRSHTLPSILWPHPPLSSSSLERSVSIGEKKKRVKTVHRVVFTGRPRSGTHQSWLHSTGGSSVTATHTMQGTLGDVVQLCVQRRRGS